MKYLVVDACLNGTGIRDQYEGGYISPEDLGLSLQIVSRIKNWLTKYERQHYKGYNDIAEIYFLDSEGIEIAQAILKELFDVKIKYYSDATMKQVML